MADEHIETGLAGLTVTVTSEPEEALPDIESADRALATMPQPPTPAYPKAPMPEGWNMQKVSALVRDLAQNMYDIDVILKRHNLTEQQYRFLADNEYFKSALQQFTVDWNTASNTQKRLALEAAIYLEDGLPNVAARMNKPTEPLADVVALVKVLAEIAGTIGAKAANQPNAPTEKFKIIINLGADVLERNATTSLPPLIDVSPVSTGGNDPLRSFLEASGVSGALQSNVKGS